MCFSAISLNLFFLFIFLFSRISFCVPAISSLSTSLTFLQLPQLLHPTHVCKLEQKLTLFDQLVFDFYTFNQEIIMCCK